MIAVKLAVLEVDGHAVEGGHRGVAVAVDLHGVDRRERPRRRARWQASHSWAGSWGVEAGGLPTLARSLAGRERFFGASEHMRGHRAPLVCFAHDLSVLRLRSTTAARFCSSCGPQLHVVGDERRVVTVLFARPRGLHRRWPSRSTPSRSRTWSIGCFERLVEDIAEFGGRVDKIVGDAIVALFGAPIAHEDDAERAVRAALRMQETIAATPRTRRGRRRTERARCASGSTPARCWSGALRAGGDYTAMGDVVNTASRLQTSAAAGRGGRRAGHLRGHPRRHRLRAARPARRPGPGGAGRGLGRRRGAAAARAPAPPADGPAGRARRRAGAAAQRVDALDPHSPGPARARASATPASARRGWPRSWPTGRSVEHDAIVLEGRACPTARPTCGGRRRGAPPGLLRSSPPRRSTRPGRAPSTASPQAFRLPRDDAEVARVTNGILAPDGLRGRPAGGRPVERPGGGGAGGRVLRRGVHRATSRSSSSCPTCTGPTTRCSS